MIVSIDPGRNCTGWALWDLGRVGVPLTNCGLSLLEPGRFSLGRVCHYHELRASDWGNNRGIARVVVEQMALTTGRDRTLAKAIATGNDLLELQAIGAFIAGRMGGEYVLAPIGTWKGSAPKDVTRARAEKTLTPAELAIVRAALKGVKPSLHHNLYDALGIGLWATGRYVVRPGSVPHNHTAQ